MKRIISIIAAAVLLAGCAANSGKTPMPPAWALGFWTIADRNTDADDIAEGVSALRNAERPADAFVIGAGSASGFSSTHSLESIHKLDARVAVDLRGKPEGYWKRVMKKFNADTWIVDNPVDAEELLAEASKGNKRPFLLSAILKSAQGSSTVALTTTAGIVAPLLPVLGFTSPVQITLVCMAIGAGAMTVSHANDSYFWVVNNLMGITETKEQIEVWSITSTIAWAVGFVMLIVLSFFLH